MRVLVACEFSQIVTKAFRLKGHEAFSCDLLPTEGNPDWHIQAPVETLFNFQWDLIIAHPPCQHLAVSGARWFKDKREEQALAIGFFMSFTALDCPRIAIETPSASCQGSTGNPIRLFGRGCLVTERLKLPACG